MSYINKGTRIFKEKPEKVLYPVRSEARLKNYISASDLRAWSDIVEERRQHILEYQAKNREGFCLDKLIPLDILFEAMMANKNDQIKALEKRVAYLENMLDIYSQLELTPEQQQKLEELVKENNMDVDYESESD